MKPKILALGSKKIFDKNSYYIKNSFIFNIQLFDQPKPAEIFKIFREPQSLLEKAVQNFYDFIINS